LISTFEKSCWASEGAAAARSTTASRAVRTAALELMVTPGKGASYLDPRGIG
jgi:hypothetical protein